MPEKKSFSFVVTGGEANAGPPIGPALGPLGLNVMAVVKRINELTEEYKGMKVPVVVEVDQETKAFNVTVKLPPTSALILKEAGLQKGSGQAGKEYAGSISMQSVIKIAKLKMDALSAKDLKGAVKTIIGTCVSMGIKVEDKEPKAVIEEINRGLWDKAIFGSE